MATCSVEGCNRITYCKGMCQMHYARWKRQSDLSAPKQERGLVSIGVQRFSTEEIDFLGQLGEPTLQLAVRRAVQELMKARK